MSIIKIDDYTWHYCLLGGMKPMPIYIIIKSGSYFTINPATYHALQCVSTNPFHQFYFSTVEACQEAIDAHLDKLECEKNIIEVEYKEPKKTLWQEIKQLLGVEKCQK